MTEQSKTFPWVETRKAFNAMAPNDRDPQLCAFLTDFDPVIFENKDDPSLLQKALQRALDKYPVGPGEEKRLEEVRRDVALLNALWLSFDTECEIEDAKPKDQDHAEGLEQVAPSLTVANVLRKLASKVIGRWNAHAEDYGPRYYELFLTSIKPLLGELAWPETRLNSRGNGEEAEHANAEAHLQSQNAISFVPGNFIPPFARRPIKGRAREEALQAEAV